MAGRARRTVDGSSSLNSQTPPVVGSDDDTSVKTGREMGPPNNWIGMQSVTSPPFNLWPATAKEAASARPKLSLPLPAHGRPDASALTALLEAPPCQARTPCADLAHGRNGFHSGWMRRRNRSGPPG